MFAAILTGCFCFATPALNAQGPVDGLEGTYQPLYQMVPPGVAGYWSAAVGRAEPGIYQPVKVLLPTKGVVTFYDGPQSRPIPLPAPARMGVAVGHIYRLKIDDMPDYPGIQLYPSFEILDRLHPPPGQVDQFPIPIEFTREELEYAIRGRLVTKVVYLEQPQLVRLDRPTRPDGVINVASHRNLMSEADREGRPMVLIRIGGRIPDIRGNDHAFFYTGGPLARPRQ